MPVRPVTRKVDVDSLYQHQIDDYARPDICGSVGREGDAPCDVPPEPGISALCFEQTDLLIRAKTRAIMELDPNDPKRYNKIAKHINDVIFTSRIMEPLLREYGSEILGRFVDTSVLYDD